MAADMTRFIAAPAISMPSGGSAGVDTEVAFVIQIYMIHIYADHTT